MNFSADKKEISSFINLYFENKSSYEISVTLKRFTETTNEDFLDNRANYIKNEVQIDTSFCDCFTKLAGKIGRAHV